MKRCLLFHRWEPAPLRRTESNEGSLDECARCGRVRRTPRCPATTGLLVGYRCDLDRGHAPPHQAETSRTTDDLTGRVVGWTTIQW